MYEVNSNAPVRARLSSIIIPADREFIESFNLGSGFLCNHLTIASIPISSKKCGTA